ncbi:MAG: lysostaphin resistance A-like protein, partial [Planctomycetota bacterium]
VTVAALMALDALLRRGGWDQKEQPLILNMAKQGGAVVAAFIFGAVVLAPVAEERFFRGHVFRHLLVHTDARTAYLVSALLFAAAHGNLSALPSYLVYALILSWSYERWRTLWVPTVAHAVANGVAVATILAS